MGTSEKEHGPEGKQQGPRTGPDPNPGGKPRHDLYEDGCKPPPHELENHTVQSPVDSTHLAHSKDSRKDHEAEKLSTPFQKKHLKLLTQ